VRGANKGAEIHHSVLKIARPVGGNELCRKFPQFLPTMGRINWRANIEKTGENASGVGFDDRQGFVESENCDCVCGVSADSGQRSQQIWSIRKFSAQFSEDGFGATMKISRSRIVTEAFPGAQNLRFSRRSKRADGGKPVQPPIIVRDDGSSLGLLEHDFGNQDGVGIVGLAPGEIAFALLEPG